MSVLVCIQGKRFQWLYLRHAVSCIRRYLYSYHFFVHYQSI